jgi:PTS system mannose-specific IIA component
VQGTEVKETLFAHIHRAVQRVDGGSGVLILTDLYGATPSNVAHEVFEQAMNLRFNPTTLSADRQVTELAIVAGMSLPMVLRAIGNRALPLPQLVEKVCDGGHQAILYRLPHTTAPPHQYAKHQ